jgi:hypothetical protein
MTFVNEDIYIAPPFGTLDLDREKKRNEELIKKKFSNMAVKYLLEYSDLTGRKWINSSKTPCSKIKK